MTGWTGRWRVGAYAWLSIATAIATIGLKAWGYWLTNSVALFSDALESLINLVTAVLAAWMLWLSAQPPDKKHNFGHDKFEYFSSGLEGLLILGAVWGIGTAAWERLWSPQPMYQFGWGVSLTALAVLINGATAMILLKGGRKLNSIALHADAHHLLTDVWTSLGAIAGLGLVQVTGQSFWDPLIAFLVAGNIVWTGIRLLLESAAGLVDSAISPAQQAQIKKLLQNYEEQGIRFHALRTRRAGKRQFVEVHVLVPNHWTVKQGHDLCDRIEREIAEILPHTHTITHLEPTDDPLSWTDDRLL
jgi:cation diffusion facilitator family transporter